MSKWNKGVAFWENAQKMQGSGQKQIDGEVHGTKKLNFI